MHGEALHELSDNAVVLLQDIYTNAVAVDLDLVVYKRIFQCPILLSLRYKLKL